MLARLRLTRRLARTQQVPLPVAWARARALRDPGAVRSRLDAQHRRR